MGEELARGAPSPGELEAEQEEYDCLVRGTFSPPKEAGGLITSYISEKNSDAQLCQPQ